MKKLYTAEVIAISGRDGSVQSNDDKLSARLTFPKEMGGTGQGTNPEQLFAAGHAACFGSSLSHVAKSQNQPVSDVRVKGLVSVFAADDGGFDLEVVLEVSAKGQDRQTMLELIEKAKNVCAYSRSTKGMVRSTVNYKE